MDTQGVYILHVANLWGERKREGRREGGEGGREEKEGGRRRGEGEEGERDRGREGGREG